MPGPPTPRAAAQPSPHVHAASPGTGRAAQRGLTAQSRLSVEPRGLPMPWESRPRRPPPPPPTALVLSLRSSGSDVSSSQESLGPSSRWSEASGSSTDEVCGPRNSVWFWLMCAATSQPSRVHPESLGGPRPPSPFRCYSYSSLRKRRLGTGLELFFSLFGLEPPNPLFSVCFPTGLMAHAAGFRLTSALFHPPGPLLLLVPAQLRPVGGTQRWWGQCPWACSSPGVLLPSTHSKPGVSASILTLRSPRLWALQQRDHLQDTTTTTRRAWRPGRVQQASHQQSWAKSAPEPEFYEKMPLRIVNV